jgi:hypothetical protein
MNPDNCIVDMESNTIRTDIDLTRFLYIEWNSEQKRGGAGLGHILYSISSLLQYYVTNEREHRTIIFSDQWRPDWERHSPKSQKTLVDIRDYYNIGPIVGTKFGQQIKVYFDHRGIFRDTFSTNDVVGIASLAGKKGCGLTKVRENNKNIIEVEQLNEHELLKYNYNFWCGGWHTGGVPLGEVHLEKHEAKINVWSCYKVNSNLQNKAKGIVEYIRQTSNNKNALFYVMHLRRGDRLQDEGIAGSSDISFVVNQLTTNVAKESSIYIMTNGTVEYVTDLKTKLQTNFNVFTKQDFPELTKMGDEDNFALFSLESEMCSLSNGKITNRDYSVHNKRIFSLLYRYTQIPYEVLITKNEDLLIKVQDEGKRYKVRSQIPLTLAFGSDNKFVFKDNCSGCITFDCNVFGEDPNPGKIKFGYIKIGNKKDLIKIGEENASYSSSKVYTAIYGAKNKFYCKRNLNENISFSNNVFGDPLPGIKKNAYIIT